MFQCNLEVAPHLYFSTILFSGESETYFTWDNKVELIITTTSKLINETKETNKKWH